MLCLLLFPPFAQRKFYLLKAPARLSDGEFVFTKKATDQMGSDNLQMMMDDAERAFDGGEMRMPKQRGGMMYNQKDEDPLAYEKNSSRRD